MRRIFAVLAIAMIGSLGPAMADSAKPPADSDPAGDIVKTLPVDPTVVPKWIGHAVDDILSGDVDPDKDGGPDKK